MKKIIVEEKDVGKRLDSYITEKYSELSRTMIRSKRFLIKFRQMMRFV